MIGPEFVRDVYQRVPAYRAFLEQLGVSPDAPWAELPLTTKTSYLLTAPTDQLCWDGSLADCHLIGASSGFSQTGAIHWPKRPEDERDYLHAVEQMLVAQYGIDQRRTLLFVCMAFGTWIAGIQLASGV